MELYQAYTDFNGMMDLFEDLLSSAAKELLGTYRLTWQGEDLDLTPGWPRLPMHEGRQAVHRPGLYGYGFRRRGGGGRQVHRGWSCRPRADPTWGNALYEVFDQKVEEKLIQPPSSPCPRWTCPPLAKRSPPGSPAHRAVRAVHSATARWQRLLRAQRPHRPGGPLPKNRWSSGPRATTRRGMMDEDFLTALEYGLPPTGGPRYRASTGA